MLSSIDEGKMPSGKEFKPHKGSGGLPSQPSRQSSQHSTASAPQASPGRQSKRTTSTSSYQHLLISPVAVETWRIRDINWKFVLGHQHWGTVCVTLIPALVVILFVGFDVEPPKRDIVHADPNLMHGTTGPSIPLWASVTVPTIFLFLNLCMGEFWLHRPCHGSITNAVYAFVFFLLEWGSALSVVFFFWKVSKVVVARPRPDYFAICEETVQGQCNSEPPDARDAYFSIGVAVCMMTAMFHAIYSLSMVYQRAATNTCRPQEQETWLDWLVHEIGHAVIMYLILMQIGFGWVVNVRGILDHRNFVSDMNAGMILGAMLGLIFGMRSVLHIQRVVTKLHQRRRTNQLQHKETASSTSTAVSIP